jgi:predicted esterase
MNASFLFPFVALLASLRAHGPWGVAYAPADTATSKPAIVFLHGMWAGPEDSCGFFERGATPFGFLVCPRGNASFGAGTMWAGTSADAARSIRTALLAAEALAPGRLDRSHGGTLIGYSNGAYFAAEVAYAQPGRWAGLVLLSMKLDLTAARLHTAGVERVVLAAAEQDGARAAMAETAARLSASGLPTRFMSLGPGGHELPRDISARMCDAIAWVRAEPAGACAAGATN